MSSDVLPSAGGRDFRSELEALTREAAAAPALASDCAVAGMFFGEAAFLVTVAWRGAEVGLWVRLGDHDTPCFRKTARFKLGYRGSPPHGGPRAFVDELVRRLEEWEAGLPTGIEARLFGVETPGTSTGASGPAAFDPSLEWIAVQAGLKPACRLVAAPNEAEGLRAAARAADLQCQESGASPSSTRGDAGKPTVLYVARTVQAAVDARDAEQALIRSEQRFWRRRAPHVRKFGAALGYPACCIEAFIPVRDRPASLVRFYALARTEAPISFLLNDLVDARPSLLDHFVCRYDCAASLRYARALFERLDRSCAEELRRIARGYMIAFREGDVLRLVPSADGPATPRFALVEAFGDGRRLGQWRSTLERGDAFERIDDEVCVKRGEREIARLPAPASGVQLHGFF